MDIKKEQAPKYIKARKSICYTLETNKKFSERMFEYLLVSVIWCRSKTKEINKWMILYSGHKGKHNVCNVWYVGNANLGWLCKLRLKYSMLNKIRRICYFKADENRRFFAEKMRFCCCCCFFSIRWWCIHFKRPVFLVRISHFLNELIAKASLC